MLQMTFTTIEENGLFIAGAILVDQGRRYVRRVVFPAAASRSKADRKQLVEIALEKILDKIKLASRIDLRTDHYHLLESRWSAQSSEKKPGRHQIAWTLLPPTSRAVFDVREELRRRDESDPAVETIFIQSPEKADQLAANGRQ